MSYVYELSGWPHFTWDLNALAQSLGEVRKKQGRLFGKMEAVGFELNAEADLVALTQEVVKSCAIEGQYLNTQEVRSSVASRLGLSVAGLPRPSRDVEGVVDVMLDATRQHHLPLTEDRLFGWHAALFPTGHSGMQPITAGAWRTDERGPMRVVSGPIGKERVHFQAPEAAKLAGEMRQFLAWFNGEDSLDLILKAGVAHFWFVTLHPFDDGNGRLARAVADMVLAKSDGSAARFYSMSSSISAMRNDYYTRLESAQRGSMDITAWLAWFVDCLNHALDSADKMLAGVLFKAAFWRFANCNPINERQCAVMNRMLEEHWQGYLNTSKYAKLAKCSQDTALRDIKLLCGWNVLIKNASGGRSTSYRLVDHEHICDQ